MPPKKKKVIKSYKIKSRPKASKVKSKKALSDLSKRLSESGGSRQIFLYPNSSTNIALGTGRRISLPKSWEVLLDECTAKLQLLSAAAKLWTFTGYQLKNLDEITNKMDVIVTRHSETFTATRPTMYTEAQRKAIHNGVVPVCCIQCSTWFRVTENSACGGHSGQWITAPSTSPQVVRRGATKEKSSSIHPFSSSPLQSFRSANGCEGQVESKRPASASASRVRRTAGSSTSSSTSSMGSVGSTSADPNGVNSTKSGGEGGSGGGLLSSSHILPRLGQRPSTAGPTRRDAPVTQTASYTAPSTPKQLNGEPIASGQKIHIDSLSRSRPSSAGPVRPQASSSVPASPTMPRVVTSSESKSNKKARRNIEIGEGSITVALPSIRIIDREESTDVDSDVEWSSTPLEMQPLAPTPEPVGDRDQDKKSEDEAVNTADASMGEKADPEGSDAAKGDAGHGVEKGEKEEKEENVDRKMSDGMVLLKGKKKEVINLDLTIDSGVATPPFTPPRTPIEDMFVSDEDSDSVDSEPGTGNRFSKMRSGWTCCSSAFHDKKCSNPKPKHHRWL